MGEMLKLVSNLPNCFNQALLNRKKQNTYSTYYKEKCFPTILAEGPFVRGQSRGET